MPRVTPAMILAARQAEQAFYRARGRGGDRFIGMPPAMIRGILEAALSTVQDPPPDAGPDIKQRIVRPKKKPERPLTAAVVMARKPRRW